ncbi:MAG: TVP38/TMEM64 family protein [Actinomycetes bacterium]|jgi:uncharacterized membrane protein YdjX (TVP38/TMEM64 family)|nr:TVP38/TMEM64 family protein [Actinomycetes bacterium]
MRKRVGVLIIALLGVAALVAVIWWADRSFMTVHRSLAVLKHDAADVWHIVRSDPSTVSAWMRSHGDAGPLISIGLTLISGFTLVLPTAFIVFANAYIWGFLRGTALTMLASLITATACFWVTRRWGRPIVERVSRRPSTQRALAVTDRFFERYGARTVLIARLIPIIPFDLISLVAGLTDIQYRHFILASAVGLLPEVALYSWIASVGGSAKHGGVLIGAIVVFIVLAILVSIFQKPLVEKLLKKK